MNSNSKDKFDRKKYNADYKKEHYKRVPLDLPLDKYDELKEIASSIDEPINTFIKTSINERIKRLKK